MKMTVEVGVFGDTIQRHCMKNCKQIFLEIKLYGLVPNSFIHDHESVSKLQYIFPILIHQQNRWTNRGNL